MHVLLLVVKLIPMILALVELAEKALSNVPKSGEQKKEVVMTAVEALAGGASAVFTGGAADTWERIKPYVSTIIDGAASIAFPPGGDISAMGEGH